MKLLALALFATLAVGTCERAGSSSNPTGDAISKAEARRQSASYHVETAKPHTDKEGKVSLNSASNELTNQGKDLKDARAALKGEQDARAAEQKARQKLDAKWYVRYGRVIDAVWKSLLWSFVIALVLRVLSQTVFAAGPFGSVLAFVSTAIFGVLSGGISVIQSIFDNAHFRRKINANAEQQE